MVCSALLVGEAEAPFPLAVKRPPTGTRHEGVPDSPNRPETTVDAVHGLGTLLGSPVGSAPQQGRDSPGVSLGAPRLFRVPVVYRSAGRR
ncbi:hypothetical protein GCM10022243_63530 [Saccharothrix violaceirubra]